MKKNVETLYICISEWTKKRRGKKNGFEDRTGFITLLERKKCWIDQSIQQTKKEEFVTGIQSQSMIWFIQINHCLPLIQYAVSNVTFCNDYLLLLPVYG